MSKYCDDCLTIAYDNVGANPTLQEQFLSVAGQEIEDHMCAHKEESDIPCKCPCNKN